MMNFTGKGKKDLHLPHTLVLMLITLQQQVSNGVTPLGVCVRVCVCVCVCVCVNYSDKVDKHRTV